MVKLIALLGNKGTQYRLTRHNCGWLFCDILDRHLGTTLFWQENFHGSWTKTTIAGLSVVLLKPMTFMNESGRSIGEACRYFNVQTDEVLVVHDDIETTFGTIKLQSAGGLGGHNGLRSTVTHLGSDRFFRLRIGVGRPVHGDVASFVLSRFSPEEEIKVPLIMQRGIGIMESFLTSGCRLELLPMQENIP
jgi:peptidyl-tRNA hydrolase, PTH1 family